MEFIDTIEALEAQYGRPSPAAIAKVARRLTPAYLRWIMASRFCVVATAGPEGADASPRGDDGPVVAPLDAQHLTMPDWRGNNRLDSLRNIVRDGRIALMFMVPGSDIVLRVNGSARVTADAGLRARFQKQGRAPATVIIARVEEVYPQCSRAIMRAQLWQGDESAGLPTLGEMLAEVTADEIDGAAFDRDWPERARKGLW